MPSLPSCTLLNKDDLSPADVRHGGAADEGVAGGHKEKAALA